MWYETTPVYSTVPLRSTSAARSRPALLGRLDPAALPDPARQCARPRAGGKPRRTWTLRLAAEVCWECGLTPEPVRIETIRQALTRLGVNGRRAKRWITSPDPPSAFKKRSATG
jgi:hypothetical protein